MKPFENVLGNNSELRLLEFLLPLHGVEFNVTDLANEVKISRVTATRVVKKFVEWNVLTKRHVSNITYYSINENSPLVKSIEQFNNVLIETMLGTETLYEIRDYLVGHLHHISTKESELIQEGSWPNQQNYLNEPIKESHWDENTSSQLLPTSWVGRPISVKTSAFERRRAEMRASYPSIPAGSAV